MIKLIKKNLGFSIAVVTLIANLGVTSIAYGAGATLPFLEYEAEHGITNAKIEGPSTKYLDWAAEASGRKYVKLDTTGQFVEWKSTATANSIVVRFSIPDSASGKGIKETLSLYVNGVFKQKITLDSQYAWNYGDFPWTNNPADGRGHKVFDEVGVLTNEEIPAGATIKLQKDNDDNSPYYIIDLMDLEKVTPIKEPLNSLSITSFGAIANDGIDDSQAIKDTINAAKQQNKIVWIPTGDFNIENEQIKIDNVTIKGAGMWFSKFVGLRSGFRLDGDNCKLYNFSVRGVMENVKWRDDNSPVDSAFEGFGGKGSVLDGIWVEHKKCGFWVGGKTDGLVITNSRFRNLMADAVNFCNGTSNSIVSNTHVRYSGDDSLATWSPGDGLGGNHNIFDSNTIQLPWLANGIAIYGGSNHVITNNLISDTVTGGAGIYISSNFKPVPLTGTITVEGNVLNRCGSNEHYLEHAPGALWVNGHNSDIVDATINMKNNIINDATTAGITIQGPKRTLNINISDTTVNGTSGYGLLIQGNSTGNMSVENLKISNAEKGGILNKASNKFKVWKLDGNVGW